MTRLLESKEALVAGATRGADEATQAVTTVGTLHLRRISQKVHLGVPLLQRYGIALEPRFARCA